MDTQLNFINRSHDQANSEIVIFSKNVATGFNDLHVAWIVIQNCGVEEHHPFTYPTTTQVAVGDAWGNYSPQLDAQPGDKFAIMSTSSGDTLVPMGVANPPTEIQIENGLQQGTISANCYKDGRLLATKTSVAPGQVAAFEFQPTIWIGAASQVTQGKIMNSAIVDAVNTELSLLGIASADIVMTGGGPGQDSTPLTFTLQNVVEA
ncbi:MAG: hypothetical protein ACJ8ER_09255 [Allosphingosinicella sp.]